MQHPGSAAELQELVAQNQHIKTIGTRHSFNGIADTTGEQVALERLDPIFAIDRERRTVTIGAGVRYGDLGRFLHGEGWALHNLASLPHISVAGAVATATHGSGDRLGNLATSVAGLEIVTADGKLLTLTRREHGPTLAGAVVGLGALGIVTRLTLDVEPTYAVQQFVHENLPLAQVETQFDAIMASATSVSLFTDWRDDSFQQVWRKQRLGDGVPRPAAAEFFGARPAADHRHPLAGHAAENCTRQLGIAGPWHERLPHFRLEYTPSSGDELQSEYFVARRHSIDALRGLQQISGPIADAVFVSEVRTIAADELWLSPCYQRDSVAFHFTWKPAWPVVQKLLPVIEAQLAPFDARPHWGKLFTIGPARLRSLYPRHADFLALRARLDPAGKFRNAFLDACLGIG